MRPPDLKTKIEVGRHTYTRARSLLVWETGAVNPTILTIHEPEEVSARLKLYPDLVEACECAEQEIRLTRHGFKMGRAGTNVIGLGKAHDALTDVLARCQEEPDPLSADDVDAIRQVYKNAEDVK